MKVIIAGSRDVTLYQHVLSAVAASGFVISEVVSGGARGVDLLGEQWAEEYGVPVKKFPANWHRFGRRAGVLRNRDMATYADALVAVWDGESRGTRDVIECVRKLGKSCYVHRVERVRS